MSGFGLASCCIVEQAADPRGSIKAARSPPAGLSLDRFSGSAYHHFHKTKLCCGACRLTRVSGRLYLLRLRPRLDALVSRLIAARPLTKCTRLPPNWSSLRRRAPRSSSGRFARLNSAGLKTKIAQNSYARRYRFVHLRDADVVNDIAAVMANARQGTEIVIELGNRHVVIMKPSKPIAGGMMSEVIADLGREDQA